MAWKASELQIRQVPCSGFFAIVLVGLIDAVLAGEPSGCVREPGRLQASTVSLRLRDSGGRPLAGRV